MTRPRPRSLAVAMHFAALIGTLLVASCGEPAAPPPQGVEEVGGGFTPSADFRLPTLEGGELGPPDFAGKAVVVDFWATWCLPCKAQASILEEVHAHYSPDDVQFLAVDVAEDAETVRQYVAERPFPYPVLLDTAGDLMTRLQLMALPTLMVVSREGEVIHLEPGLTSVQQLRGLLQEAGVEPPKTALGEAASGDRTL